LGGRYSPKTDIVKFEFGSLGLIEDHTFEGLPEHRMVPSADQPETMRFIDVVTGFIRRQTL